jgi:SAM-dependent methyltransferase
MEQRLQFYATQLNKGIADKHASILVVAGGKNDVLMLRTLGFTNAVISNIMPAANFEFAPYSYKQEDATRLSFADNSFDYVIISAALHHLHAPHAGLLEVYRVARKGALVFEATDNLLMRIMIRLGIAEEYELSAVKRRNNLSGGINNTEVPNYVYRWTKRELVKTLQSYAPHLKQQVAFAHGLTMPYSFELSGKLHYKMIYGLLKALLVVFPSQCNLFCAHIRKPVEPDDLQDWMKEMRSSE